MAIGSVPTQKHAVSFEHIKLADQTKQSGVIWKAIMDYLQDRPNKNFADVEQKLRAHQCFTRLIAAHAPHPGYTPCFREHTYTYHLFISTKELKAGDAHFLGCAEDAPTNLKRLAETGILVPSPKEKMIDPHHQGKHPIEWRTIQYVLTLLYVHFKT